MLKHNYLKEVCEECEFKLQFAHPDCARFYYFLKENGFNEVHISESARNQEDQQKAFTTGKSKTPWPNSKHNFIKDGKQCSLALDLFKIDKDGIASFPLGYYFDMYVALKNSSDFKNLVRWGGDFKSIYKGEDYPTFLENRKKEYALHVLLDGPHFELIGIS